jgi:hypothetical protein
MTGNYIAFCQFNIAIKHAIDAVEKDLTRLSDEQIARLPIKAQEYVRGQIDEEREAIRILKDYAREISSKMWAAQ